MLHDDTPEEIRIRRQLLRKGLVLLKSPAIDGTPARGPYAVGSIGRNAVIYFGPPNATGATLDEIAAWLAERSA